MRKSYLSLCLIILGMGSALWFPSVNALILKERDFVCPIDGEKFKATLAASGTSTGQFLDMKPFGPIAAPWPVAKCPSNGFVIYKETFTKDEIRRLREYVNSEKYKEFKTVHSDYYLIATLRGYMGEKPAQLAFTLLQATWEAKSRLQYEQYAVKALEAYKAALIEKYADTRKWIEDQLVAGELERRLGQFDNAKARFVALSDRTDMRSGFFRDILDLQLQLIKEKDNRPKMIPQTQSGKK